MESVQMVIVGAGQSGLAAAFGAHRAGIDPVVLEATRSPAGSWPAYYASLRLFSPARYSSLPGLRFPGDPERYPTRDEVAAYLSDYAAWLAPNIRYHTRVDAVTHADGQFTVAATDGSTIRSPMLIAASGSFGVPHRPQLKGIAGFQGPVLHSGDYKVAEPFAGLRIVVAGAAAAVEPRRALVARAHRHRPHTSRALDGQPARRRA